MRIVELVTTAEYTAAGLGVEDANRATENLVAVEDGGDGTDVRYGRVAESSVVLPLAAGGWDTAAAEAVAAGGSSRGLRSIGTVSYKNGAARGLQM